MAGNGDYNRAGHRGSSTIGRSGEARCNGGAEDVQIVGTWEQ
jgi:hypothetical protein